MSVAAEAPVFAPDVELAPGYVVVDHLSRGKLFDVYDVWSVERDCRCVAKTIRPERLRERRGRLRLRNEGGLLLELNHMHIVRAYELIQRPHPILVMETLPGFVLEYVLEEEGAQPPEFVALLGRHLCSALHYLHGKGYLHADIKPANVILSYGIARLIDLSLARRPGRGHRGAGTHDYLAPEQARGGYADASADVWGLGTVLWEAAAGERAFRHDSPDDYTQVDQRAEPIATRCRLPRELAAAIDACLEPLPCDRPTVPELAATLDALL